MGEEQRQALARLFAEDEEFKAALLGAMSVEDAVRIASEHGFVATADDFASFEVSAGDISDSELEMSAGGTASLPMCYAGILGTQGCPTYMTQMLCGTPPPGTC